MSARTNQLVPVICALLGAAGLALSVLGLEALSANRAFANPLTLAAGLDRRANMALAEGDLAQARALSTAALGQSPYDTSAWLRLALLDAQSDGKLDAAGVKALATSYQLLPYDQYVVVWRSAFCLEHWSDLPPEVRAAAKAEALAFAKTSKYGALQETLARTEHPSGRVVAALWSRRLKLERAR